MDIPYWSDASANPNLGLGVVFGNHWTYGKWEPGFIKKFEPSIEYLEFYAVCCGFMTWGHLIRNTRVNVFCDNMLVVYMINDSSLKCRNCMYLLRMLVVNNLLHNRRVFAKHIRTEKNILADSLSRMDLTRFWKNAPSTMRRQPDPKPDSIWPPNKIWNDQMCEYLDFYSIPTSF